MGISHKEKPCRGTGKAKGYGCETSTMYRTYGLCQSCLRQWAISEEEGMKWLKKQTAFKMKREEKEKKKQDREKKAKFKEENKSIAKLISEAKLPFQKWIRFRDANRPCISCGTTDSEIWDGGHFYKAELYTGLIFDEDNVHKQCRKCNTFLGGNENNYRLGLIERYGEKFVEDLDNESNEKRTYKFTKEEIREIKKKYQKLLLNLKKE